MSQSSQPLVTVVTPMYNCADFLVECIESVLAQTYQNWEYVIVDNLSTDGSADIARRYAARDPRVRLQVNTEFLPAIANHNAALRQLSPDAKYCKVVFADDWIFPECLEKMVAHAEAHPSAGIVSAYCLEGDEVICSGLPFNEKMVSGREICRRHFADRLFLFGSANTLLYQASMVRANQPFFNNDNVHADNEVCFAMLKSTDFGFVHQVLTFTRLRTGSLNTVSNSIHSSYASTLRILDLHGSYYWNPEELRDFVKRERKAYYNFLGKSVVFGRDKKFWDYHRKKLTELGLPCSRLRFARAALAYLFFSAPTDALRKLVRRRR